MPGRWKHHAELLAALVAKEFRVRYRSSALGVAWSLLHPLAFALVIGVAFGPVLDVPREGYVGFLLAGLFPWQWFANTVGSAPSAHLANASLVKRTAIARALLPAATAGNHLVHFLVALAVATPVLALAGHPPTAAWLPGVPLLVLLQGATGLGLALALAALNVVFRDLEHLTGVGLNLLFFLTPVVYPESALPAGLRGVLQLNPMVHFVPLWRRLALDGQLDLAALPGAAACAVVTLAAGAWLHARLEPRLAEAL